MSLHEEDLKLCYNIGVCRVCLSADSENGVDLNLENGWFALFEFCVGLSLTSNDEPHLLCKTCADTVKTYVSFKEKCHKSDKLWKSVSLNKTFNVDNVNYDKNSNIDGEVNVVSMDNYFKTEPLCSPCGTSDNFEDDVKLSYKKDKQVANCQFCKKRYKNKKSLVAHIRFCKTKSKQQNVESKGKIENNQSSLLNCTQEQNIEICNTNQAEGLLFCGLCKFSSTNVNINQHLEEHWLSNELTCKLCDFVAVDAAHFLTHRFFHYPECNKPRYFCHICKAKFSKLLLLQYHYRVTHLNKIGGLCWYCKKQYSSMKYWRHHMSEHESTLWKYYICDHCGKKFAFKHALSNHMQGYHLHSIQFICETCGRRFSRKSNLTLHRKCVHEKSQPIKCTHCNRMFKNPISYADHQRILNAPKPVKCEVCSKSFTSQAALSLHSIWHSDERPFPCTTCGARFKVKSYLQVHVRKHTGDRPFKCPHCERSFPTGKQLKVHSSVHTGVRAHKCSHCERSFHDKKQLHAHLTKCH